MEELTEGQKRYRKYKDTYKAYRLAHKERARFFKREWSKTHKRKNKTSILKYIEYYRFGGMKKACLERDGYVCTECGMTNEEHKNKWNVGLTIHHIDGKGRYSKTQNNNLDNLITLCLSCHGRIDVFKRKNLKIKLTPITNPI